MNPADLVPDAFGHFGPYGGRFVPETLVSALEELEVEYKKARTERSSARSSPTYWRIIAGVRPRCIWLSA